MEAGEPWHDVAFAWVPRHFGAISGADRRGFGLAAPARMVARSKTMIHVDSFPISLRGTLAASRHSHVVLRVDTRHWCGYLEDFDEKRSARGVRECRNLRSSKSSWVNFCLCISYRSSLFKRVLRTFRYVGFVV